MQTRTNTLAGLTRFLKAAEAVDLQFAVLRIYLVDANMPSTVEARAFVDRIVDGARTLATEGGTLASRCALDNTPEARQIAHEVIIATLSLHSLVMKWSLIVGEHGHHGHGDIHGLFRIAEELEVLRESVRFVREGHECRVSAASLYETTLMLPAFAAGATNPRHVAIADERLMTRSVNFQARHRAIATQTTHALAREERRERLAA